MPELAEVEFNRKQWDAGLGQKVRRVELHSGKRLFRGLDTRTLCAGLTGAWFRGSDARGKRLLFWFSGGRWLGLHLGMTGRLRTETPGFTPGRHDHLVLRLSRCALVFADPRLFGQVRFASGPVCPEWWQRLPPPLTGPAFTLALMDDFLRRHGRLAIKGALLRQDGFPGVGNWMADEILWRARIDPRTPASRLGAPQRRRLWRTVRWVSRRALAVIGRDNSDLPRGWLFHERWSAEGLCPVHRHALQRRVVAGRATAWCPTCTPGAPGAS